jgi:hypothetical protein
LKKPRNAIWSIAFVVILLIPLFLEFIYLNDYAPVLQRALSFWRNRSYTLLLSDLLFIEGGIFLILGALFAGVILYNAWVPTDVRRTQFTEYIWNWKVMDKERGSTAGALAGIILIVTGIAYIITSILITI